MEPAYTAPSSPTPPSEPQSIFLNAAFSRDNRRHSLHTLSSPDQERIVYVAHRDHQSFQEDKAIKYGVAADYPDSPTKDAVLCGLSELHASLNNVEEFAHSADSAWVSAFTLRNKLEASEKKTSSQGLWPKAFTPSR
ncbi:hypothetical protein NUW54_g4539 [Trametes sanguinea]|uniref:Uncharacterized protein n=1 Tax=Trametes sanguinea TaxID=158606 RepID=A0ACC1PXN6_9APHY|nr:hypothetical protein NUW54_g4539 [Trametes sanguinea]